VFVVAFTGAMLVFQPEIEDATEAFRKSKELGKPKLPPSIFISKAKEILPNKNIYNIKMEESKTVEVMFYNEDPHYQYNLFFDPYNAQPLKVQKASTTFFGFMMDGHTHLWLGSDLGMTLVRIATLIFIVLAITGLIKWYPRSGDKSQRFKIKWKSSWRRRNFDLHSTFGFYVLWIGIFSAITGSVMGFKWFESSYYYLWSGGENYNEYLVPSSDTTVLNSNNMLLNNIDSVFNLIKKDYPNCKKIELVVPNNNVDAIEAWANVGLKTHGDADVIYYDQHTLKQIAVSHPWNKQTALNFAQKVRRTNIDLHLGNYFNFFGKLILFIATLLVASLPITGILLWYGRRKKKRHITAHLRQAG
jgi:uncharacterized iron-regulated membrane protein